MAMLAFVGPVTIMVVFLIVSDAVAPKPKWMQKRIREIAFAKVKAQLIAFASSIGATVEEVVEEPVFLSIIGYVYQDGLWKEYVGGGEEMVCWSWCRFQDGSFDSLAVALEGDKKLMGFGYYELSD
ncbi:MAG: hypothetical protein WAV15_04580 [Minisyncoccia bacterium]